MSKTLTRIPTLKVGTDAAAAKYLTEAYGEAQNGLRKVIAVGLCCFSIKKQLPHGQFQNWLEANCPGLSYRSLAAYMQLTKNVLEKCGFRTLGAYFKSAEPLHFSHGGEILLLPDAGFPEAGKPIREKICAVIDGKTQSQLFLEFKQVDEDGEKPKRGRLKGQGGATREQRAAAKDAEDRAEIEAMELDAEDFCKWIDKVCDQNHLPLINASAWAKLFDRQKLLGDFMRGIERSRKGGKS